MSRGALKRALLPAAVFLGVLAAHFVWMGLFPEANPAQGRWAAVAQPVRAPWLDSYLATGSVWLGLSYGLALAFAATSFRTYREERQCLSRNAAIGGVTLSGVAAVAGCFLVGCCGSPMLGVYLGLFGAKVLPFTKPFIAVLTALSVLASWAWMKYARRQSVSLPLCPDGKCALGNECG